MHTNFTQTFNDMLLHQLIRYDKSYTFDLFSYVTTYNWMHA